MLMREIENRLKECANVREACVVPGPAFAGTARYVAFVVLGKKTDAAREQFQVHCNARLKQACPAVEMQLMDRLPRTAAGAVSRRALTATERAGA
jgi:acyl-coenzyme A synthetase/AMP-(fatty) acid ligase